MNQRNYQKELDKIVKTIEETQTIEVPKVFLHSCCAPCSSYCLEYLSNYFEITVFYYNPNIYPEEEYRKRVIEQQNLLKNFRQNIRFLLWKENMKRISFIRR